MAPQFESAQVSPTLAHNSSRTVINHTLESAMDDKPPRETQAAMMQRIALEDLQRRRQEIAPQVDANIEETLKICEQRLEAERRQADHWDTEFNFWHKIISEEVERLRFNEGYEPISIDLYPCKQRAAPDFQGKTQVGHVRFNVTADWGRDSNGVKILRIRILKA